MKKTKFQEALPEIIALSSLKKETSFERIVDSAVVYYGKSKDQKLIEEPDSFYEFIESFYTQNQWNWTENKAQDYFNCLTRFSVCVLFKGSLEFMKEEYRDRVKYVACKYLDQKVKEFSKVSRKAFEERIRLNKIPEYVELNQKSEKILSQSENTYIAKFVEMDEAGISQKLSEYQQQLFFYLHKEEDILNDIGECCYGSLREYKKHSSKEVENFFSYYASVRWDEKLNGQRGRHWKVSLQEEQK